jgi:hypothetical protein
MVMAFNATFNNISVLLMQETGVSGALNAITITLNIATDMH